MTASDMVSTGEKKRYMFVLILSYLNGADINKMDSPSVAATAAPLRSAVRIVSMTNSRFRVIFRRVRSQTSCFNEIADTSVVIGVDELIRDISSSFASGHWFIEVSNCLV